MTSTIETPTTISPCPSWCPDTGNHLWSFYEFANPDGTYNGARFHRVVTCDLPHPDPKATRSRAIVACEKYESTFEGPFAAIVEITDGAAGSIELCSPDRVAEFVAAIQRAAAIAFPSAKGVQTVDVPKGVTGNDTPCDVPDLHTLREAERELRSAEAEVAQRAGRPANQLTAAWIRLRKAHAALAASS